MADPNIAMSRTEFPATQSFHTVCWAKPHHFINVPVEDPTVKLDRDCPAQGCILSAIARTEKNLADRPMRRSGRRQALRFFGHFMGDIHQPLHVSYKRDLGGNKICQTDTDKHLIKMPAPVRMQLMANPPFPTLGSKHRAEPVPPETHRLLANVHAPIVELVLDLPQGEWKFNVHHHGQPDDLGRCLEVFERIFHSGNLEGVPP